MDLHKSTLGRQDGAQRQRGRQGGTVTVEQLRGWLQRPDVIQRALGEYTGNYSIGISGTEEAPNVLLRVEDDEGLVFEPSLTLGDESVPLVVETGYRVTTPFGW